MTIVLLVDLLSVMVVAVVVVVLFVALLVVLIVVVMVIVVVEVVLVVVVFMVMVMVDVVAMAYFFALCQNVCNSLFHIETYAYDIHVFVFGRQIEQTNTFVCNIFFVESVKRVI